LILDWEYQPERVQAGIYLLFYTLLASLPLLVGILFIYNSLGSLCLFLLSGSGSLAGGLFHIVQLSKLGTVRSKAHTHTHTQNGPPPETGREITFAALNTPATNVTVLCVYTRHEATDL